MAGGAATQNPAGGPHAEANGKTHEQQEGHDPADVEGAPLDEGEDEDAAGGDLGLGLNSVLGPTGASAATFLLHAAARAGDVEKTQESLAAGADPNVQDAWGLPALHSAALAGHGDVVSLLLKHAADINLLSARVQTPLHLAVTENHTAVVGALIEARADVALTTAYGNTALELAMQKRPGGPTEALVREELRRRYLTARADVVECRERLKRAEEALEIMSQQLGQEADTLESELRDIEETEGGEEDELALGDLPSISEEDRRFSGTSTQSKDPRPASGISQKVSRPASGISQKESRPESGSTQQEAPGTARTVRTSKGAAHVTPARRGGYWYLAAAAVEELKKGAEAVSARACLRELPLGDIFPHKGPLISENNLLAETDPADPELLKGFERLQAVAEMQRMREERWATRKKRHETQGLEEEDDSDLEDHARAAREAEVLRYSGRTQEEWDKLVADLSRQGAKWDWSRLEVLEKKRDDDSGKMAGVFAFGRMSKRNPNVKPVFEKGEIIGPLGGTLRRRSQYEQEYYAGRIWVLHDTQAHELSIRARTSELSIEPLVIDLTTGSSQNRLRHIADARNDPMGLRDVLSMPSGRPSTAEGLSQPRAAMRRPRSRGSSPSGIYGDRIGDPNVSPRSGKPSHSTSRDLASSAKDLASSFAGSQRSLGQEVQRKGSEPVEAESSSKQRGVPPGETEEDDAAQAANVTHIEVLVDGWPYVFVVATRNILPGEELVVDRGLRHWQTSRFMLQRLRDVNQLGRDVLLGTKTDEGVNIEEETVTSYPDRKPRRKVGQAPVEEDDDFEY